MHQIQSKSFDLYLFVSLFLWQRFHRKGDKFRYVSASRGKPVIRVLPRAKTALCFLIESAVITIFLGGYTVWQQQLSRQSRRMS